MSSHAGMTGYIEPMIGRYVHVEIGGETHRIYFEENGKGIPLVCLHTAGSDNRQWRYLLADEEFAKRLSHHRLRHAVSWQVKSAGRLGRVEEYQLTTARYTETIRAFCKALKLEKPVVMGCSIGGRIVLNLAIDHAGEFRALIGLEAADFQAPWYDTAWLNRPDVHGGEVCAALVSGLIAPQSPMPRGPRRCGPTSRAVPASSRATSISTGSTATCAARWRRSILKYVRSTCSRASMISPARPRTHGAPHPRYQAPVSPSWRNSAISR